MAKIIGKPETTQQNGNIIKNAGLLVLPRRNGIIGREVTFPALFTLNNEEIKVRLS